MDRRRFLSSAAIASGTFALPEFQAAVPDAKTTMGLVIYCRRFQRSALQNQGIDLYHPPRFLEECIRLGAAGMQVDLSGMDEHEAEQLAEYAAQHQRFIESIIQLPKHDADIARFDHDVRIARRCGAHVARTTILPGRRYEQFSSYADFHNAEIQGEANLRRAIPVLSRHGLKVAIENHKDQRNDERLALLERLDSEFVGACVDTGNSMALLEDPIETVRAFAPWALSVHLKDQALQRVPDGFLLADIALGAGCLDLKTMIRILRDAKPDIRFSLELITRDPLVVPCLRAEYFRVFQQIHAADLAHMIQLVEKCPQATLPKVSTLPKPQQLQMEESNVEQSIAYASFV